jgi:hypothetical protein
MVVAAAQTPPGSIAYKRIAGSSFFAAKWTSNVCKKAANTRRFNGTTHA